MDKHQAEPQNTEPEVVRADARHRKRVLILLFVAALIGAVVILVVKHRLDDLGQQAKRNLPAAVEQAIVLLRVFCWFNCVCFLGIGGWSWRLGRRINRAGRFPPPGMKVVRDTRVCTGAKAQVRASVAQATALLCVVVGTVGMWYLYRFAEAVFRGM